MSLKFKPMTEDEVVSVNLLPQDNYDFEVVKAVEKMSKSGKEMIELQLKIHASTGTKIIFDYLLFTDNFAYKVRHFFYSIGMGSQYDNAEKEGIDVNELSGRMGKLKLIQVKDKEGLYPPRNSVSDYIVEKKSSSEEKVEFKDDDIPW